MIKIILMINRRCCVTLVLLDSLSTKHDITGSEHCEHTCMSSRLVPLTLKFQFSTHINNFELTGEPFKLIRPCHHGKCKTKESSLPS